ncbi:DoxX family protein [uncultured Sphingomonas sp.]|uniref:DoxX family protein n=1 Tax=uncultured Sphingomonas sp. TaxID=158754 RepID=UPI0025EE09D5|nr:DoxX family protein [uncultured Sphingomonas sp.]
MRKRTILRVLLIAAFTVAGVAHIKHPQPFVKIVPWWVPFPRLTVVLTGWCELAGAAGLITRHYRRTAGMMFALYSVCVFPANIKHALDYGHSAGLGPGWLYHGPRLLFQPVIVWWSVYAGGLTDWPFTKRSQAVLPSVPADRSTVSRG